MRTFIAQEPEMSMTEKLFASRAADRFFAQIKANYAIITILGVIGVHRVLFHGKNR